MNYNELYDKFITLSGIDKEHIYNSMEAQNIDISDGMHIVFGFVVVPYIIECVSKRNHNLKEIFSFLEDMANSNDIEVSEVLDFTILEALVSDKMILADAKLYMQEKTLEHCAVVEGYLG